MSLIHTVHTMNTNILPILLIVTMKNTNTNKISQSDESAKGRQMSELMERKNWLAEIYLGAINQQELH
jgi:hypothetical protein